MVRFSPQLQSLIQKFIGAVCCATFLLIAAATPAQAEVKVITENFTKDTVGNYAPLNFYDATYGSGSNTGSISVPITVPKPAGAGQTPKLAGISLQMHDHSESVEVIVDVYSKGQLIKRVANYADVGTGSSDANCGGVGGFVSILHSHHLPQNEGSDNRCMEAHTFEVNQEADTVLLTFHCRTSNCRNQPQVHLHIGQITWWIDVPASPPPPEEVPTPTVAVLGCVDPNATQQLSDLLRISWTNPTRVVESISISDSNAANRWDRRYGRFWTKPVSGTSTTAPAGFAAQTPNTSTLIFKPSTTYSVVAWNGENLSQPRDVTFTACSTPAVPATVGEMLAQCSNRNAGDPLLYNIDLVDLDLRGGTFVKTVYYIQLPINSSTASVRNFLGKPNWTENNMARYWVGQSFTPPVQGRTTGIWQTSTAIGSTSGNQKTLADLEAWTTANNTSQNLEVAAMVQTNFNGTIVESNPIAISPVTVSKASCVIGGPVCPRTCGVCSAAGSPDGCGGSCEKGSSVGTPNAVQVLTPQAGTAITLNPSGAFQLTWRQNPVTGAESGLVSEYQGVVYKQDAYPNPDAALADAGAANVRTFTQLAALTLPETVYSQTITLNTEMKQGPLVIAIKSRNLQCPAENPSQQESAWTVTPPYSVSAAIAGKFYLTSNGSCSVGASTPITLGNADVTATAITGTVYQNNFGSADGFSFTVPAEPLNYRYQLGFTSPAGENLRCAACNDSDTSTPQTCDLGFQPGPTDSAHFFVQNYSMTFGPWWQTWGGLIYGHTGIRSNTPDGQFLSRALSELAESSGIAMTNGAFSGLVTGGWWNEFPAPQPRAEGSNNRDFVTKENYEFFVDRLENGLPAANLDSSISSPPAAGATEGDARILYRDGDLLLAPDATWNVGSGDKRIIFVNGNLTVRQMTENQKITTVEQGGYLAFIVKENITFEANVGYNNPGDGQPILGNEPLVTGVFIANGQLTILSQGSEDRKFVGGGTFVGWNGISMPRTFENAGIGKASHETTPTDTFIFRPDFLVNTPQVMRYSDMIWQEIR